MLTTAATVGMIATTACSPDRFSTHGIIDVPQAKHDLSRYNGCLLTDKYRDFRSSMVLWVADGNGNSLTNTRLDAGMPDGNKCRFRFQVDAIEDGHDAYTLHLAHYEGPSFSAVRVDSKEIHDAGGLHLAINGVQLVDKT